MAPIRQEMTISSSGSAMRIVADYSPKAVFCTVYSGSSSTKKAVPIPAGVTLISDSSSATLGKTLNVGQRLTLHYLNPLTLSLDKVLLAVEALELATLDRAQHKALRIRATTSLGTILSWETQKGLLLKAELPLGMAMYTERPSEARSMSSVPPSFVLATAEPAPVAQGPADIGVATAIVTNRTIEQPREVARLVLEISGLDDPKLAISDHRQSFEPIPGRQDAFRVTIRSESGDGDPGAPTPPPSLSRPGPLLDSDDPKLRRIALDQTSELTGPAEKARAIARWVKANMAVDYSIGTPRSCTEILGKRRGVCRDFATLFVGLARAAGIPSRAVGGLLYAEGKFYYHAWGEVWTGGWLALDPTIGDGPVDATHLKLTQGGVNDIYGIVGAVGRLRIDVVEAKRGLAPPVGPTP
jgi:transglutaminase-like putative cysteine protease